MAAGAPRQRSTLALIAGIAALAAAAWAYLAWMPVAMPGMGMSAMEGADAARWSTAQFLPVFLMWAIMMAAMMLPGAAPAVLVFDRLVTSRQRAGRAYAGTWWFVAGYLGTWSAFSVAAALAQSALHASAALSASMMLTHPFTGAAVLAAAGAYQLSPLKGRCLSHCRSPLEFLMLHWREGRGGAFLMGVQHGTWCVGCCWLLMSVLFVVGVMNLAWIGLMSLLVIAEKTLPHGQHLARAAGFALLGWAAWRAIS